MLVEKMLEGVIESGGRPKWDEIKQKLISKLIMYLCFDKHFCSQLSSKYVCVDLLITSTHMISGDL